MIIRAYKLRFLNPAFLGNADQSGQWRGPPFKRLLRQWWRMAWAVDAGGAFKDIDRLRLDEAALFGGAAGSNGNKSPLRTRLSRWNMGGLESWDGLQNTQVAHLEVERANCRVNPYLYLGWGPLINNRQGTVLKANAAINAGDHAILRFAFPKVSDQLTNQLDTALSLMSRYGTIGARSRNGWGAFVLSPLDGTPALLGAEHTPFVNWQDALRLEWPHALGKDENSPLIWQTRSHCDWQRVMTELAELKIKLRTHFKFTTGRDAASPEQRHWLSYPVSTSHSVNGWQKNRLPNTLRFKVREIDDRQLCGVIFHVPCRPPNALFQSVEHHEEIVAVWREVYQFLDGLSADRDPRLTRVVA